MKKINKILFVTSVLLLVTLSFIIGENIGKNEVYEEKNKQVTKSMLSMMLETEADSGEYQLETRANWPTKSDGYIFNKELSKCEQGSKLTWNDVTNEVLMTGNSSDKCYVYFDVYVTQPFHKSCNENTLACYVAKKYTDFQGASNLYYHDSTLENGAGDNSYRYAGSSDTTFNFVCFGSDATPCPDDNLYRIIGVFGDQVKLVKWDYATSTLLGTDGDYNNSYSTTGWETSNYIGNKSISSIGAYYWNYDGTTYGTNIWSTSELNTVNLNTNFLNNIGTTWANKIAETTWKVGGNTHENIGTSAMNVAYQNEIVSPAEKTTYTSKIGLMYVSDYGYAASPTYWTYAGYNSSDSSKDYREATGENWMYMGLYDWTIVRRSDTTNEAFYVSYLGLIGSYIVGGSGLSRGVRPVFFLKSDVIRTDGTGLKSNPYRLS